MSEVQILSLDHLYRETMNMVNSKGRAEIFVSGRVQGVGYRYFTEDIAAEMSLTGSRKIFRTEGCMWRWRVRLMK